MFFNVLQLKMAQDGTGKNKGMKDPVTSHKQ
jgi:hypothetical protein